jgi:catechol 2,3-dioxygenase
MKNPNGPVIGHVHLTVSDLARSVAFYRDLLGFRVTQDLGSAVFLASGGYHHHIGLNTWRAKDAQRPREGQVGLYHVAILYPDRKALANALKRLLAADYSLDGAGDHGVSESIYLRDPDGNGLELYCDRAAKDWPKTEDGKIGMTTQALDIEGLLHDAD